MARINCRTPSRRSCLQGPQAVRQQGATMRSHEGCSRRLAVGVACVLWIILLAAWQCPMVMDYQQFVEQFVVAPSAWMNSEVWRPSLQLVPLPDVPPPPPTEPPAPPLVSVPLPLAGGSVEKAATSTRRLRHFIPPPSPPIPPALPPTPPPPKPPLSPSAPPLLQAACAAPEYLVGPFGGFPSLAATPPDGGIVFGMDSSSEWASPNSSKIAEQERTVGVLHAPEADTIGEVAPTLQGDGLSSRTSLVTVRRPAASVQAIVRTSESWADRPDVRVCYQLRGTLPPLYVSPSLLSPKTPSLPTRPSMPTHPRCLALADFGCFPPLTPATSTSLHFTSLHAATSPDAPCRVPPCLRHHVDAGGSTRVLSMSLHVELTLEMQPYAANARDRAESGALRQLSGARSDAGPSARSDAMSGARRLSETALSTSTVDCALPDPTSGILD